MRTSPWLQRKFDSYAAANRPTVKDKLKAMKEDIHPDFRASFKVFKKELLWVLKDYPTAANDNIAHEELDQLKQSIKDLNQKFSTDLWDAFIDDLAA